MAASIDTLLQGRAVSTVRDGWVRMVVLMGVLAMACCIWKRPSLFMLAGAVGTLTLVLLLAVGLLLRTAWAWLDPVLPWLSLCTTGVLLVAFENVRLRGVFARFIPRSLVDRAMTTPMGGAHEKGQTTPATVVFVDLEGYTSLSESVTGEQLVALVNQLHEGVGAVFERYGGTVIDYMGDAQMVVFGVPTFQADHAMRAVQAVQALPPALRELNELVRHSLPEVGRTLHVGVGIASGPVTWAAIGSRGHQEFAALGDTTNVAARLQAKTRDLDTFCLMNEVTYEAVRETVRATACAPVSLRGKSQPLQVYALEIDSPREE